MRIQRIMMLTAVLLAAFTPMAGATEQATPSTRTICPQDADPASCLLKVATGDAGAKAASGPLTAGDLQEAYRLPADLLGGGQTVAVVVPYDIPSAEQDLATYRAANGLPACDEVFTCFRKVNQRGGDTPPPSSPSYAPHAAAGLDLTSAACPNCRLLLVQADDPTFANMGLAVDQAVAQGADAVVVMWGFTESADQAAQAAHFDHPGVTITSAAGTGFNTDGRQTVPSAFASVIAVGGTELFRDPAVPRGWRENVWRDTGSGCSLYVARPAWQRAGACGGRRTVADVSAVSSSSTPVQIYSSALGGWAAASGTPLAAAFIAGVYGLAGTDSTAPAGKRLYARARYLHDITGGANGVCAGSNLCAAGQGYDGPSGMGTPDGTGAF
ncbi:hypothetical protein OIE66_21055 [Nonomuraea sp. NBC_01738]|uniref:hypothetical protein n=1 Tax=Nonomuraea sp. NBC_01738 TaxID=2976003 RepID=UPI002E138B47|nr:hypothetical protein OIE66_21055 [Nonomuraea sp. NBC_01738]